MAKPLAVRRRHKPREPVPHVFVLDAIAPLSPYTRPMLGCLAVYVDDQIVLVLRHKPTNTSDSGVWLATTREHHDSLRRQFPNMRSIQALGKTMDKLAGPSTPMHWISKRQHGRPASSWSLAMRESARCRIHGGPWDRSPQRKIESQILT
jgi:hypothetical protein